MFANTLQVRKVIRAAIKQHNGESPVSNTYTEKTSKKNPDMRHVVFYVRVMKARDTLLTVQQEFERLGYTNKPFLTHTDLSYIRCKATLAK